jgi:hypothetical protein
MIVMLTGLHFSLQNQTRKREVEPIKWRNMPEQMVGCESTGESIHGVRPCFVG